ncbi:MAG: 50S ribosome-binding GTPase, partial [Muribaculaceae bacterium]|nr:50S ribosome-binding GTPase [Muribaculaceae bacterium]
MKLTELKTGQTGIVVKIHGHGAFRKRVIEMGFVKGHAVTVVLHAPLRDPIKYSILGYEISLRRAEADLIEVVAVDSMTAAEIGAEAIREPSPDTPDNSVNRIFHKERHTINVALIGNPNCGKTSLFNIASGAREHVGNYSGVTVDARDKSFNYKGYRFNIVDLPGTYSLTCYSPEELYVRQYLRTHTPDVIINVVDSSNLERNLFLTTELIDMDTSMVIALNMFDELREHGDRLDYDTLGRMIGVPMVPVVSKSGEGIDRLFDSVIAVYEGGDEIVRHIHVNLGTDLEGAIRQIVDMIKESPSRNRHFSPRYFAIKLLEGDHEIEDEISAVDSEGKQARCGRRHRSGRLARFFRKDCCGQKPQGKDIPHWRRQVPAGTDNPIILLRDKLRGRIESLRNEDISSMVA